MHVTMVSAGLNFKDSILAMFIGYGIVVVLMMLIAAQSAQTGRPTVMAVSRAVNNKSYYFNLYSLYKFHLIKSNRG